MRTGIILHPENFSKKSDIDNELGLTSAIIQKKCINNFQNKNFRGKSPTSKPTNQSARNAH